jgi:starch synthase (maltosyl-transferring)
VSPGEPQAASPSRARDPVAASQRVAIEGVSPEVDGGRYPVKRVTGDLVVVEADVFTDGHDALTVVLMHRAADDAEWQESPMEPLVNDRWRGAFRLGALGLHHFTLEAWVDPFATWSRDIRKKAEAGAAMEVDFQIGATLVAEAVTRADPAEAELLRFRGAALALADDSVERRVQLALDPALALLMHSYADRRTAHRYEQEVPVWADRERARFGSWYEFFPRSCSADPSHHGTFVDCEQRLEYAASLGFDVVYLPPVQCTPSV